MTDQLKEFLEQIILKLEKDGPIEIDDGYARMDTVPDITMGFVDRLIGGGWLIARIPSISMEGAGKPGYGGRPIVITAPGPAWWDYKQRMNAEFLAAEMHVLAEKNQGLQQALANASEKFNRIQRGLSLAALIVGLASFGLSVVAIGLSQGWW